MPHPFERARTLAVHPAYDVIEVYDEVLVCVRGDGSVTEMRMSKHMAELTTAHLNGIRNEINALGRATEAVSRQVDTVQSQQAEMDNRLM